MLKFQKVLVGVIVFGCVVVAGAALLQVHQHYRSGEASPKNPLLIEASLDESQRFYKKYQAEIFRTLRAEPKVRMVQFRVPGTLLRFRRNLATGMHATFVPLKRSPSIPVIAVSRNSQQFLDKMRIDYLDPSFIPQAALSHSHLPMAFKDLQDYVLVPDVSRP